MIKDEKLNSWHIKLKFIVCKPSRIEPMSFFIKSLIKTNQFSNEHPERIRYWIKENIHMVWDAVQKLQKISNQTMVLRITFYVGSYPIVMQWYKLPSPELKERDCYVSENL